VALSVSSSATQLSTFLGGRVAAVVELAGGCGAAGDAAVEAA